VDGRAVPAGAGGNGQKPMEIHMNESAKTCMAPETFLAITKV
jgi:hypothetical protein